MKLFYILDKVILFYIKLKVSSNLKMKTYTGYITINMLLEVFPKFSDDALVCLCGPPKMVKLVYE